jgi:hypothetical protein
VVTPILTFVADLGNPELFNDVTDAPSSFNMTIPIAVTNTHTAGLYFRASLDSPPLGYTAYSTNFGLCNPGGNIIGYLVLTRNLPTLTAGEHDESLTIKVEAFTDAGYSVPFGNQSLATTMHHFNHTDGSWTVIGHDNFDDTTVQGWSISNTGSPIDNAPPPGAANWGFTLTNAAYFSAPCALQATYTAWSHSYKNFNTVGKTKARLTIYVRAGYGSYGEGDFAMKINGVLVKRSICRLPTWQWVALSFNMPTGASILVEMCGTDTDTTIDDVWVIAK